MDSSVKKFSTNLRQSSRMYLIGADLCRLADGSFTERSNQFALREDVTFHSFEQFAFVRAGEQAHRFVEREELEKITMRAAGRAGSIVADVSG